jgi:fibronectin type 3 domain-containing protein
MKSVFRFLVVPFMLLLFALAFTGCGGGGDSGGGDKPSAPTNVKVTPGNGIAIVSWDPVSGAKSYNIYYSTTKGATEGYKASSGKIENATSPYTVTGLTNGTVYYFEVTAVNSSGESGSSGEVSTTPVPVPAIPAGISVTGGDGQITVAWDAVTNATSYNVYYGTSPGVTKTTGIKVSSTASPKTITGLVNGTTYYVVVTAVNAAGESAESAERYATPSAAQQPPARPSGASATPGDKKVTVTWTAVDGATSYNVYYASSPGVTKTTGTKVAGVTSPCEVSSLTNGVTYYFVVTAVGPGGESAESSEQYATPSATLQPPASPNGVKLANGAAGQIKVTWNTKLTATSYNIYYTSNPAIGDTASGGSTAKLIASGIKISVVGVDPTTILTQSYTVTGLTTGTTYYFVVTSQNAGGESGGQNSPKSWPAP